MSRHRVTFFIVIGTILLFSTCLSLEPPEKEYFTTLEVENNSPYEIQHLYAKLGGESGWGPDLLKGRTILPGNRVSVNIPGGEFDLKADIFVGNQLVNVKESLKIVLGKTYSWTISQDIWLGQGVSYEYLNTYEYLDTYGYM
ncbi:MAG: hypothetical protein JW881_01985 [Spirochaetales bacterium]|nr:hypothetical protein [Spirochaetales bacterium]